MTGKWVAEGDAGGEDVGGLVERGGLGGDGGEGEEREEEEGEGAVGERET